MEADDAGWIRLTGHGAAGEQRLGLRSEAQRPAIVGVIERLDAERITGEQQPPTWSVPESEGKHAAQLLDHGGAAVGVKLEQHLGVGLGAEGIALGLKFGTQGTVVIDLAVE